ncbi:DEAD/DEAH box helicase family protein [bacterium]|nr:DEAD/DEAH box helicase family protein [bacterium]
MLELKDYQNRVLESLKEFFDKTRELEKVSEAYRVVTEKNFGQPLNYREVNGMKGLPYVCLRVPTGGGKTVIACSSIHLANENLLQKENSLVLWLVPSNTIREQTLKTLKDSNHFYHKVLKETLGSFEVLDILDARFLNRTTILTNTTIIVSTIQSFRVNNTEGRKVYEENGHLMSHFENIQNGIFEKLDTYKNGEVIPSLANLLCINRPVVIVDEAHNSRTSLSFETLERFNPSCIVEFTATPDTKENPSNVLHSVSAAELYAEQMIKLPIQLETKSSWKDLLGDSIQKLTELKNSASLEKAKTGEYIRPLMLIQAQAHSKNSETRSPEVVKECLINDFKIQENEIAIETGASDDLKDVNLSDSNCPINYVITIQKLREGWDCPFAYVLCSVAEMHSNTAVEQIVGRILRLPQAKSKTQKELNKAFVYVASSHFSDTLNSLADALVQNGVEKQEAKDLISYKKSVEQTEFNFSQTSIFPKITLVKIEEVLEIETLPKEITNKFTFDREEKVLSFEGEMTETEKEILENAVSTPKAKKEIQKAFVELQQISFSQKSPSERGERLIVPVLSIKQGDFLEQLEETHFIEMGWDLLRNEADLPNFSLKREGVLGEIKLDEKGKLERSFIQNLSEQISFFAQDEGWKVTDLVSWLDRNIPHSDLSSDEFTPFLLKMVNLLIKQKEFRLEDLVHQKFNLKKSVEQRINELRRNAYRENYQELLFNGHSTEISVTPERCFEYQRYDLPPYSRSYKGSLKFKKHFYNSVGDFDSKTEERCAEYFERSDFVKTWVRNFDRRVNGAFWLQTSSDKFYPDFVCKLNDERILVVETKGEHIWSNDDSEEKRQIGELWESRSNGKCLFTMPKNEEFEMIENKIKETGKKSFKTFRLGGKFDKQDVRKLAYE